MVVMYIVGIAVAVVSMLVSNRIGAYLGVANKYRFPFEAVGVFVAVFALSNYTELPMLFAIILALNPIAFGVLGIWYHRRSVKKARSGDYGKAIQWSVELQEAGDDYYIIALNTLTREDMMEIQIIADSKEELRELTIERFEEQEGGELPEDFA